MDSLDYPDIFGTERYSLWVGTRCLYRTDNYPDLINAVDYYSVSCSDPPYHFRIHDKMRKPVVITSCGEIVD